MQIALVVVYHDKVVVVFYNVRFKVSYLFQGAW